MWWLSTNSVLQVLRNDTCVLEKDCEVCDEEGHHPGDVWKKDKCTYCTCEGTSLKCETERCSGSDKICEEGYQVVKIPGKEDECCDKYGCGKYITSCNDSPTSTFFQYWNLRQDLFVKNLKLLVVAVVKL